MTVAKEKLQILSACWWTRSRPEERTFQAGETVVPRVGECFLGGMARKMDLRKGMGYLKRGRRRRLKILRPHD